LSAMFSTRAEEEKHRIAGRQIPRGKGYS
jgi:hypothetical protein